MNFSKNKIFMLIAFISMFFYADILPQKTTSRLENSRLERTKEIRNKKSNQNKTNLEKSERIKDKRIKPTRNNISVTREKNNDIVSRKSHIKEPSKSREREARVDAGSRSRSWRRDDSKRRRKEHSPKVHITRQKKAKPFIDYHNPYYFRCFTFHDEIVNHYPSFPLRFVSANIEYLYNVKNNYIPSLDNHRNKMSRFVHFFEVNIEVNVKSHYWEEFGVLVQYPDGSEQIILFNEDGEYLFPRNVYKFSKVVALENFGNINLRLGYYDFDTNSFYPAVYSSNKTDLSIFISKNSSYTYRY
jgi:hypothetical protein